MKLILLVAVTTLIILALRVLLTPSKKKHRENMQIASKIVPCALCQLHIPLNDAIKEKSHFFCSAQHLEEWQRLKQ